MQTIRSCLIQSLCAAAIVFAAGIPASALPVGPVSGNLASQFNSADPIIEVRDRGGAAAAFLGGLVLGGIIAAQRPYYYDGYNPYPDRYYPAYRYRHSDPAIAYCMRRFKSYDPYTMTYLGYDGLRHGCP